MSDDDESNDQVRVIFAAATLPALVDQFDVENPALIAKHAFKIADAMMDEREKTQKNGPSS
jgi:hypothetical protein